MTRSVAMPLLGFPTESKSRHSWVVQLVCHAVQQGCAEGDQTHGGPALPAPPPLPPPNTHTTPGWASLRSYLLGELRRRRLHGRPPCQLNRATAARQQIVRSGGRGERGIAAARGRVREAAGPGRLRRGHPALALLLAGRGGGGRRRRQGMLPRIVRRATERRRHQRRCRRHGVPSTMSLSAARFRCSLCGMLARVRCGTFWQDSCSVVGKSKAGGACDDRFCWRQHAPEATTGMSTPAQRAAASA